MAISLRERLAQPGLILAPSVYNALGALVAERAGFTVVSVTGNGLSAAMLGRPDVGLLTMSEVVGQTRYIAAAASVSVIADADTGYGGPLNVYRTVKEFAAAGAAAVHIEDQEIPKRCAYLDEPPVVVSVEQQLERLRAARAAADETGILLIARTDAHRAYGIDEAIRRCLAYAEAGADLVMSATLGSVDELARLSAAVPVPVVVNLNVSSPIAGAGPQELEQAGAKVVVYPSVVRNAVLKAMWEALQKLRETGRMADVAPYLAPATFYDEILSTGEWVALERRFMGNPE
ncbi:MAG TPA: isocitrate lyase/PEP mutase family protein [Bacillota bacterium]